MLDDVMAAAAVQWLRKARASPDRIWARFIHRDLNKLGGLGCLNALRNTKDNEKEGIYLFNQYLMKCWRHLKREEPRNETTFLSQTIWKNRRFAYSKGTCVVTLQGRYLMSKGYTRVGDFFDYDGRVIEAEGDATSALPLRARMEWALATKHIKRHLQNLNYRVTRGYTSVEEANQPKLLESHEIFLSVDDTNTELADLTQSRILKLVANRRKDKTPYMQALEEEFEVNVEELQGCFKNITKIGYATKARSFLFKMYAGLLYGNKKLYKFGYADSKSCERCGHSEQDLSHLLVDCPDVRKMRNAVYTKINHNFSKREEMLGNDNTPYSYILLQLNRYIYQRKYLKLSLNPYEFYAMLRMEEYIESDIAIRNMSRDKHNKKWLSIRRTGVLR